MAKKAARRRTTKSAKKVIVSPFRIYWKKANYILLVCAFAVLAIGFYLMSVGPWDSSACLVFSPIVIVFAYFVVVPAAIWYKPKLKGPSEDIPDKGTEKNNQS